MRCKRLASLEAAGLPGVLHLSETGRVLGLPAESGLWLHLDRRGNPCSLFETAVGPTGVLRPVASVLRFETDTRHRLFFKDRAAHPLGVRNRESALPLARPGPMPAPSFLHTGYPQHAHRTSSRNRSPIKRSTDFPQIGFSHRGGKPGDFGLPRFLTIVRIRSHTRGPGPLSRGRAGATRFHLDAAGSALHVPNRPVRTGADTIPKSWRSGGMSRLVSVEPVHQLVAPAQQGPTVLPPRDPSGARAVQTAQLPSTLRHKERSTDGR